MGTTQSDPAILQHVFSGLTAGTTYEFRVRSLAAGNTASGWVTTASLTLEAVDYDVDNDGLIEVANLAQLNAMRWDLDADGNPTSANATNYAAAFPGGLARNTDSNEGALVGYLGCGLDDDNDATTVPVCIGYELKNNLDFDEDNDGNRDDTYNQGAGWEPIGDRTNPFTATFEGNGFTISNLFINRSTAYVGLFGEARGTLRNVGLLDVDVTNSQSSGTRATGALVGASPGRIDGVYVTGSLEGNSNVGAIVGHLKRQGSAAGRLSHSWGGG